MQEVIRGGKKILEVTKQIKVEFVVLKEKKT